MLNHVAQLYTSIASMASAIDEQVYKGATGETQDSFIAIKIKMVKLKIPTKLFKKIIIILLE